MASPQQSDLPTSPPRTPAAHPAPVPEQQQQQQQQPQLSIEQHPQNDTSDCWQDITEDFLQSAKQLDLGELVKTEQFTLFHAMSAMELMDPKMDSCMMLKQSNRKILDLEQSIEQGLKTNDFTLEELIGIIDESFACFVTWLEGHSTAQTVMTNLYLHDIERIEDRCLKIFSQTFLKLVSFFDKLVRMVGCIEEEDFQPVSLQHTKFTLCENIADQKVVNSLHELLANFAPTAAQQPRNNHSQNHQQNPNQQQHNRNQNHKQKGMDNSTRQTNICSAPSAHAAALKARLSFTYELFLCFIIINRDIALKGTWSLSTTPPQTDAQLNKTIKLILDAALKCDQHLKNAQSQLTLVKKSIDLGIKPKQSTTPPTESDQNIRGDYPAVMGFEPLVSFKILPHTYPRCPSIVGRQESYDYLGNLIERLRRCISIATKQFRQKSALHDSDITYLKNLDLISEFGKNESSSSCVISRSFLQLLYLQNRLPKLLKDELTQTLSDYCEPLVFLIKRDPKMLEEWDEILNGNYETFSQTVSSLGYSSARQHEKLPQLIQNYKNLQYSVLMGSRTLDNPILYSWATYLLARICIRFVLSGLELQLYSTYEFPYVYWFLYDILYRNERQQLEFVKSHIQELSNSIDSTHSAKKDPKSLAKNRKKSNQFPPNFQNILIRRNGAYGSLAGGLFLLMHGLKTQGKIKSPETEFFNEEICFRHRFGQLTSSNVYESYQAACKKLENLDIVYGEALQCFATAKDVFKMLGDEGETCIKVCMTNMVVARLLSTNWSLLANRVVEFSFATHPNFPTVKI